MITQMGQLMIMRGKKGFSFYVGDDIFAHGLGQAYTVVGTGPSSYFI